MIAVIFGRNLRWRGAGGLIYQAAFAFSPIFSVFSEAFSQAIFQISRRWTISVHGGSRSSNFGQIQRPHLLQDSPFAFGCKGPHEREGGGEFRSRRPNCPLFLSCQLLRSTMAGRINFCSFCSIFARSQGILLWEMPSACFCSASGSAFDRISDLFIRIHPRYSLPI